MGEPETAREADPLAEPPPEQAPEGASLLSALGARGLAAALRPLARLAGIAEDIRAMTADVARMARSTDVLPEVSEALDQIRERVDRIDHEVLHMHAAVEEMQRELEGLARAADSLPGGRRRRRARDAGPPPR